MAGNREQAKRSGSRHPLKLFYLPCVGETSPGIESDGVTLERLKDI